MEDYNRLQQAFNGLNRDNQEEVRRFFEANRYSILNLDESASPEEGYLKYVLLSSYGIAMMNKGKFSMAVEVLSQASLVEKHGSFEAGSHWKENMLRAMGTSFYFLREYGKAYRVFYKLQHIAPKNEVYRIWTGSLLLQRWKYLRKGLYIAIGFLLILDFLWMPPLYHPVGMATFIFTAVLMLGLLALEIFLYIRRIDLQKYDQ